MNVGIFCVWCGSGLEFEDEHAICLNCGTIFTNTTLSRMTSEGEDSVAIEMSITLECISLKPKFESRSVLQPTMEVDKAPAMIYG